MSRFLIYGANGYTGQLMVAEAVRRGLAPIVAGRSGAAVLGLASQYGLDARVFDLARPADVAGALQDVALVLHCAGPFSATSAPMLSACLASGTHYVDITGELSVFAACHARDAEARERGIVVLPGAGFDVVPTDCVAAMLKEALPDASSLVLAFEAEGGASAGTAKTGVEGLARGGAVRRQGRLVTVPLAYRERTFERDGRTRTAMTIPWGDLYTAWVTTGIPDIETYLVAPRRAIRNARVINPVRNFLEFAPLRGFLQKRIGKQVQGPDAETRARTHAWVWGEVQNPSGEQRRMLIRTPNGYDLTVTGALGIVARLLEGPAAGGYHTPAGLMGPGYVLTLPGVVRLG